MLTLFYCIYGILLLVIAVIDWKTKTIPDRWNIGILVVAIPMVLLQDELKFWSSIGGFFVVSVPMLILSIMNKGAFGGGDIKLMAVSGLILGFGCIMIAFFIGVLIAGGCWGYKLLFKKINLNDHVAFGPYLCMGCGIAMLYGNCIITWYFT